MCKEDKPDHPHRKYRILNNIPQRKVLFWWLNLNPDGSFKLLDKIKKND
jgi:hypothetical protein